MPSDVVSSTLDFQSNTTLLMYSQEDLENAKKRVIQLSEQINSLRFSQVRQQHAVCHFLVGDHG